MSPRIVRQWLVRVGLVGGAALVLNGCPPDAAEITEQAVPPSQNFPIASNFLTPLGSFIVNNLVLASFDPTRDPDAFGRATGDSGFVFSGSRYLIDGAARNSTSDPRLPALGGTGTEDIDPPDACRFGASNFWFSATDPGFGWDFFCFLTGLLPNTDYSVLLVRASLTVNGTLDTEEMLLTGAVTNPDALAPLGGAPGGYPTEACDFSLARPTYTVGVTGSQNPFNMGFVTTNGVGELVFDCLVGSGGFWADNQLSDPDSAPFSPNAITTSALPRYNYVLVVEGVGTMANPIPPGPTVMRFQVGVDIDASGIPIPNSLAPFPTVPATDDEKLAGAGGAGRPDSITILYNDLEQLSTGVYQQWLVNPETGTMIPGRGTYNKYAIVEVRDSVTGELISSSDSLVETVTATSAFVGDVSIDPANNIGGFRHEMIIGDGTLNAGDVLGFQTWSVLTMTVSAGGTIPDSRPFWFQYTDQNGTPTDFFDDVFILSGGTTFGNYDLTDPDMSRVYISSGAGTGGIVTTILSSDLQNLSRPPVGYVLEGWVFGIPATFAPVQTNDITSPAPDFNDLTDADVDDSSADVTPNGILAANFRLDGSTVELDYTKFGFFQVTLEPKFGLSTMGPIAVQLGALPDVIINPPEE